MVSKSVQQIRVALGGSLTTEALMKLLLPLLVLLSTAAQAGQIGADCPYQQKIVNGTVASQFFTGSRGCLVQVTPMDKPNLVYREYLFDERGSFEIFDSLTGDFDTSTGTRTYFFFPRSQAPNFVVSADGWIDVTLASHAHVLLGGSPTRLHSFGGTFTETKSVSLADQGGVEITAFPSLWLDTGWQVGGHGLDQADRSSVFHDSHGATCAVPNRQIVSYTDASDGLALFYSQTDRQLAVFLANVCPQLDLSPLK